MLHQVRWVRRRPRITERNNEATGSPIRLTLVRTVGGPLADALSQLPPESKRSGTGTSRGSKSLERGLYFGDVSLLERAVDALETLSPREQQVLRLLFGINESCRHTLEQIGERLALSGERVRQIETNALRKLRHPTSKSGSRGSVRG